VLYCIIDTGMDATNPDLSPAVISGCAASSATSCYGTWDQISDSHGTHVGGTIGAVRNGLGVVGVAAEGARMYIYNIFGDRGSFFESELVPAWDACLAELDRLKAELNPAMRLVVSMSVGGPVGQPELSSYLEAKFQRGDVLFLAAAGNSGTSAMSYPAGRGHGS
jgi:subtilisin family serine protease